VVRLLRRARRALPGGRSGGSGSRSRSESSPPGALQAEAAASLRVLAAGSGPAILLAEFPTVTTNPIQELLLRDARDHGIAPVAMRGLDQLEELGAIQRAGQATALHLHWLDRVVRGAAGQAEAAARIDRFLARLDGFREVGGRVVWTVHNILPHETSFEALEARLAGEVARRADVVHVMAARTAELTSPWYELPNQRILAVPHPSFAGVYPDHLSRLQARARLGLGPDDLVFLALGAIQAYKGLTDLLEAWAAGPEPGRRLVVAGIASDDPLIVAALDRARADPSIVVRTGKIAVQDMQVYLRAADVAVLPYRAALNSGALLLALTFGLPVVVPAASGIADLVEPAFGIAYEPSAGLAGALAEAPRLVSGDARAAAARAAEAFAPAIVAEAFARGLRARLGGSAARPEHTRTPAPG
jgi:glycosyltransferase involved in cell wall biosynthesis